MRECTQCGHDLKDTATHCDNCGAWQDPNPKAAPAAPAAPAATVKEAPAVSTPAHKLAGGFFAIVGLLLVLATVIIQGADSYDAMAFLTIVVGVVAVVLGLFFFFRGGKKN